ncbi:MAG: acyl carrier protein phosphodiesterase [Pseudomonadota bacterium]
MGDFKPSAELKPRLPAAILAGIQNHRLVDRETDAMTEVKALRQLFSPARRRFAGIITDVAFDYYLIKHWPTFAKVDFDEFVDVSYDGLASCREYMPDRMQMVVDNLQKHDWLRAYADLDGIGQTLDMLSKRFRFKNSLTGSVEEVTKNYAEIESVFLVLFKHLQAVVAEAEIEKTVPSKGIF